jgi:hypothetical protein
MLELLIFFGLMGLIVWCVVQKGSHRRPPPRQTAMTGRERRQMNSARNQTSYTVPGNAQQADLLAITIVIKRAFQRGLDGVIVINRSTQKALAIEFYGPAPRGGDGIEVEFVQSPTVERAKIFLTGEQHEMVRLPPTDAAGKQRYFFNSP